MADPERLSQPVSRPNGQQMAENFAQMYGQVRAERDRLLSFAGWVAGYESERHLVGSGVIEKAKKVLADD